MTATDAQAPSRAIAVKGATGAGEGGEQNSGQAAHEIGGGVPADSPAMPGSSLSNYPGAAASGAFGAAWTDEKHQQAMQLWRQGLVDAQIGYEIGRTKAAVRNWRVKNNLPCNVDRSKEWTEQEKATAMQMWVDGSTDTEISRTVKRSRAAIHNWRRRHGLEANSDASSGPARDSAYKFGAGRWRRCKLAPPVALSDAITAGAVSAEAAMLFVMKARRVPL